MDVFRATPGSSQTTGDNPVPAFNCSRWPECGCPDGAVASNCPTLNSSASRTSMPPLKLCAQWPECGCANDHLKTSCFTVTDRDQRIPHGGALIVLIACIVGLMAGYVLAHLFATMIGWAQ